LLSPGKGGGSQEIHNILIGIERDMIACTEKCKPKAFA